MSVIAWDGETLAADKRVTYQGLARTTKKIHEHNGALLAAVGGACFGDQAIEWYRNGAVAAEYPQQQRDKDDYAVLTVITSDGVWVYERTPYPTLLEDRLWAMGSGRDYALAAMYCGKSAQEAVEIACLFETGCGNGVDVLLPPWKSIRAIGGNK